MYLDLHDIPENADYYSLYWQLNDKYHAALLEIIDLKATLEKAKNNPVAWMRRWYHEGEKEYKVLNPKTGRMVLANKFKWLPITNTKILDDDIPLFHFPESN